VERLEQIKKRYEQLQKELSNPDLMRDRVSYEEKAREAGRLGKIVTLYDALVRVEERIKQAEDVLRDEADVELKKLAEEELAEAKGEKRRLLDELAGLLGGEEKTAARVIMEIRAGTGGEEAALFAADLMRMYLKFFQKHNLKHEILDSTPTELGGFKEVIVAVEGRDAWRLLHNEAGTHRVQRVPVTESQGRIHTSAATVAVLPEPEDVELRIPDEDLRIERIKGGGPGGQSINKTSSAVRVTHLPTGMTVYCQDERSQHRNLQKAMRILRSRLYEMERRKREEEVSSRRRQMVGSGDRSEKIRTYNFPQNRVTDHRIGLTLYKLDEVMEGNLEEIVKALLEAEKEERLRRVGLGGGGEG